MKAAKEVRDDLQSTVFRALKELVKQGYVIFRDKKYAAMTSKIARKRFAQENIWNKKLFS